MRDMLKIKLAKSLTKHVEFYETETFIASGHYMLRKSALAGPFSKMLGKGATVDTERYTDEQASGACYAPGPRIELLRTQWLHTGWDKTCVADPAVAFVSEDERHWCWVALRYVEQFRLEKVWSAGEFNAVSDEANDERSSVWVAPCNLLGVTPPGVEHERD